MAASDVHTVNGRWRGPVPAVLSGDESSDELRQLGELLKTRTQDVLMETVARTTGGGEEVEESVQQRFEQICVNSTTVVAQWICGESLETVIDAGRETWEIFAELAAHKAASLDLVTKRCFVWRNVMAEVLHDDAASLGVSSQVLERALNLLQLSLEFALLRMCESFEVERKHTDGELQRREEELAFQATHDALTGVPNRTLILDRATQMLARSSRQKVPVSALFIDLDNFKDINDTLGHNVGDELITAVCRRLERVVRNIDAVGRLGGDEFVIVAEGMSMDAGPELIAERVLHALKQPFNLGQDKQIRVTVTASIGIASGETGSAEDLLRDADIAMYRAKWDGKNRYVVFETGMQHTMQNRMELEMDLREALANEEFFLLYQPTINLNDMTPNGVEALIRWNHGARGLVGPDEFIPVLEETGMITEVGRWVLQEACAQAAEWRSVGHQIGVAVNVSGRQLDTDELVVDIEGALSDSGLEPAALTIEITETTLMRNVEETARRLAEIKKLGVRIAIDDFGTGYSSLAHLKRFPVDSLKIDRSFVAALHNDREAETLIHTLIQLGKALGIDTLAEGIEDPQELALLQEEDCDNGQGFLFAKPLDVAATEAFLERWSSPTSVPKHRLATHA